MTAKEPKIHYVVLHRPGPAWQTGVDFRAQPGIMEHVGHFAKLGEQSKVLMGGPILIQDRGGMMVFTNEVTQEEAEALAAADPAVESGLLLYEVTPWFVPIQAEG